MKAWSLPAEFIDSVKAKHAEIIDQEDLPRLPQVLQRAVELEGLHSWLWVVLWRKDRSWACWPPAAALRVNFHGRNKA